MYVCWPHTRLLKISFWNAWILTQNATWHECSPVYFFLCSPPWALLCVWAHTVVYLAPSVPSSFSASPQNRLTGIMSIALGPGGHWEDHLCLIHSSSCANCGSTCINIQLIFKVLIVSVTATWKESHQAAWPRWLILFSFFFLLPLGMLWRNVFLFVWPNRNTVCFTKFLEV